MKSLKHLYVDYITEGHDENDPDIYDIELVEKSGKYEIFKWRYKGGGVLIVIKYKGKYITDGTYSPATKNYKMLVPVNGGSGECTNAFFKNTKEVFKYYTDRKITHEIDPKKYHKIGSRMRDA